MTGTLTLTFMLEIVNVEVADDQVTLLLEGIRVQLLHSA